MVQPLWKTQCMVVSQKLKNYMATWLMNSTAGYIPNELKVGSQTDICVPVFIALC